MFYVHQVYLILYMKSQFELVITRQGLFLSVNRQLLVLSRLQNPKKETFLLVITLFDKTLFNTNEPTLLGDK